MALNLLASSSILLALNWGVFEQKRIALALLIFTAVCLALTFRFSTPVSNTLATAWAYCLTAGVALQSHLRSPPADLKRLFTLGVLLLSGWLIAQKRTRLRWQIPLLVAAYLGIATVYLNLYFPQIDLWYLQENAIALMANARSPYAATFYAGIPLVDSWVQSLPYPPGHLLTLIPGVLFGDFRWSLVVCHILAAGVLYRLVASTPRRWALVIPLVYLFYPKAIVYIWRSWTEPTLIGAIAAAIFALSHRHRGLLVLSLGAVFAIKQFGFIFVLCLWVARQISWREVIQSALVALALCLPFLIFEPIGLIQGTILTHLGTPPRTDSWSIPALILEWGGPQLGALTPFAALLIGLVVIRIIRPTQPAQAISLAAILYLVFFLMSPKAHENYYFTPLFLTLAAFALTQKQMATAS